MDKDYIYDRAMKGLFAIAALTGYYFAVNGYNKDPKLYYGLILSVIFAAAGYYAKKKRDHYRMIDMLKKSWPKQIEKKRYLKFVGGYFYKKCEQNSEQIIDDQTWDDLDMDEVYTLLDRNLTTAGEHVLYDMLRRPKSDRKELIERDKIIDNIIKNVELRQQLQVALNYTGRLRETDIVELLYNDMEVQFHKKIICNIMAAMPIAILFTIPIFKEFVIFLEILVFAINCYLHISYTKEKGRFSVTAMRYLTDIINTAGSISKINEPLLNEQLSKLKVLYNKCKSMARSASGVGIQEGIDVIGDYFRLMFLFEERNFYKVIDDIKKLKNELFELYGIVGEIDALISIASYREDIKEYSKPNFCADPRKLVLKQVRHPLIENAVANDLQLDSKGVLLTGSNMSGKSTFLRTVGVNAVLAQTIYTVTAEEYTASFFNIVTSISPSDNIMSGKSYYLGEAEAMLRIIKSCSNDMPVLCIIDEIFRGTNPTERISASSQILKYLSEHNALAIVATHDLELTELLKDQYQCYYFTEEVDSEEGLKFDYKIRKGVSPTRNALKLLRYLGYPESIVRAAEKSI
ncbi:MutS-related protein [Clostridium oryzae]|uniref:DNA mismatch repair protein MutS n=1 Tax=Clostridium oryzae TaxID=1450648 RepID=A0A1V4INQ5_9CLOT|nr:hypothetical protein [Clostridium oryzae]OPJ61546.1 DNA mismatch repair protein MutS [Clostridium oryzae]